MTTIHRRSVIRLGSGLVITLPKAWTDYYQLKLGDRVKVLANKGLMIKPDKNK